jgi:uncharacterized protein YbjT (DUF2867 family)
MSVQVDHPAEMGSVRPDGTAPGSLAAVRAEVGDDAFAAAMEDLGIARAQRAIGIDDVVKALETHGGVRLVQLRMALGLLSRRDDAP